MQAGTNGKKWLSAYLFYSDSRDIFLKDAVYPFIKNLKSISGFKRYFFIRYPERGPHIRLRILTESRKSYNTIKLLLADHFNNYFKQRPSKNIEPDWVKNLPDNLKWFKNNSVRFIDYEPELERYAGITGMEISEEQFQLSSETVLKILELSDTWNYEKALGRAMQLNLSFCLAAGMSVDQISKFFSHYCDSWIVASIREYYSPEKDYDFKQYREKMIHVFSEIFEKRKNYFIDLNRDLIDAITNNAKFEEDWFNNWISGNKNITTKLIYAQAENKLSIDEYYKKVAEFKNDRMYELFYLYQSYIHMTHNRLGLENKDEPFISFLIKESLNNFKI
ncbi:MAG: lantibiotic dehydratase C-terminal domain-containing protein [Ignavibacteria bacterium]|nr:lantibiotic dehydratase C-terminal domain-containing protein [Ignavibacteria bacterium]